MFQKNSQTIPSDSSGILLVKIIQTRRTSTRKHALVGSFLRVVLKSVKPELWKKRKKKSRAICIRTKKNFLRIDGLQYNFSNNSLVLLKKRMNTIGKELYGPTTKDLKIKKFKIAFNAIY